MDYNGLISSMLSSAMIYPIDVIKAQYQVTSKQPISPIRIISNI